MPAVYKPSPADGQPLLHRIDIRDERADAELEVPQGCEALIDTVYGQKALLPGRYPLKGYLHQQKKGFRGSVLLDGTLYFLRREEAFSAPWGRSIACQSPETGEPITVGANGVLTFEIGEITTFVSRYGKKPGDVSFEDVIRAELPSFWSELEALLREEISRCRRRAELPQALQAACASPPFLFALGKGPATRGLKLTQFSVRGVIA